MPPSTVKTPTRPAQAGQAYRKGAEPQPVGRRRILQPGRNCWRIAEADRAAVLVDAAIYYRRLCEALCKAQRSILIIGWDFDGSIKLCPDDGPEASRPLGAFLRSLVEERPQLEVRILIWSVAVVHAPGDPVSLLFGDEWQRHPRIHLHLDTHHPLYGCHHQKLVSIDGAVAFNGGIDLTIRRWDTNSHEPDNGARVNPDGTTYSPVHDIQVIVEGEAARALHEIAIMRWRTAIGETLPLETRPHCCWPESLEPDFVDVPVAIARTAPDLGDGPAIREVAALTADAIAAAERSIYIEAQYLAAPVVADLLAERLSGPVGPEVIILVTRSSRGAMERLIMGRNRDRMIRRLRRLPGSDRLRVYYPVITGSEGETEVLVHSKLMIVDDDLLRIGSANLNNRSMGLDTECDLAIEASSEAVRQAIAGIRHRLVAEHLGTSPETVADTVAAKGSLIGAVEALNQNQRRLRDFDVDGDGPTTPVIGTRIFDPLRPFEPLWFLRRKRRRKHKGR